MKIRLYNARILTMEENRPVFSGEIWIQDDRILAVKESGQTEKIRQERDAQDRSTCQYNSQNQLAQEGYRENIEGSQCNPSILQERAAGIQWDQEIDCGQNLLMPGFKNAHTHSPMTFLRSYADDLPLQEWLQQKVFPLEARLDEESIYWFGKLAVLEYLSGGITGIFDMYIRPDVMARVAMDTGIRCTLVSGLNDFTSSIEGQEEEYIRWNRAHPLVRYHLGCHAEYTCSRKLLEELSGLAQKFRAPVFLHLSETEKEVRECEERYGMTPVKFLDSLGLFDNGGGGYHCIYLDREDKEIFLKRGLYAVTNPASNLKLASGIAPLAEYDLLGIPVAIGTDGAASNNCLDMFREMFLVSGLAKYREGDASALDARKVLRMATVNGARAMGWEDADVLAEGKLADLILIDLRQPNMQPIHNIPKNLVYSGNRSNVVMTVVGGKILYSKGEFFLGSTPEEIYRECDRCLKKIL